MNILKEIIKNKIEEVRKRKRELPLKVLKSKIRNSSFRNFEKSISSPGKINIIAEIKRSSPSRGIILKNLNPSHLAKIYEKNGASAISVLTDEKFFGGSLQDLKKVREAVSLPILAKEFIIDEYQLYEARFWGADAILLIVSILNERKLKKFLNLAKDLNLDCLLEIHKEEELAKIKNLPFKIIGINNRNLETFKVNIKITLSGLNKISLDKIIVSESGIKKREDISQLREKGVNAFLIGESLLKSENPGEKLREFLK